MNRPDTSAPGPVGRGRIDRFIAYKLRRALRRRDHDWYASPAGVANLLRLYGLRDRHRKQRGFIICNGPSLQAMDLSPLRGEVTIGLNRIYLMHERLGFRPTYHVCVNRLVLEQCRREIAAIPGPKFIEYSSRDLLPARRDTILLRTLHYPHFSTDLTAGMWQGATVTYVALQLAFFLGFAQVILIGCDHHYQQQGPPHQEVISGGDDPDHFDPAYFGKGFRWQLPDLEQSEVAYQMARIAFAQHKRQVLDATVNGRLNVFPKVRFDDLFGPAGAPAGTT
jgi:hypothetical protein